MYRGWHLTNARRSNMVAESRKILGWLYKPWWMSAVTITVLRFWLFVRGVRRTGTVIEKDKQIKQNNHYNHSKLPRNTVMCSRSKLMAICWEVCNLQTVSREVPRIYFEGPLRDHTPCIQFIGWRYGPSLKRNEKRNSLSGKFRRARMV